jgi:hypothetical protein
MKRLRWVVFTGHGCEIIYEHFWVGNREGKRPNENSRALERVKEISRKGCVSGAHLFPAEQVRF